MNAIEHLEERKWVRPPSYAGFSPIGDFVILSRTRDSDALARSNYIAAFDQLKEIASQCPELDDENDDGRNDWVYDFRASHWACGWVETLLVRADAPEEVLQAAGEIVCSLADYPVLDEDGFSALEYEEVREHWARLSVRWRLEALKNSGTRTISMFAVRRDELPSGDDNGALYEYLRD